jgi:hypothetical protein
MRDGELNPADQQPPLAGPRPIVSWALTACGKPLGKDAQEHVLFLFTCQFWVVGQFEK